MSGLPGYSIVDTYKAYKARERKFTGWLKETSQKLGILPKKSSDLRIKDIGPAAQFIVAHGQTVPEDIRNTLQDVISQRKEARAFYKPHGQAEANIGHTHYISILENVSRLFGRSSQRASSVSKGGSATVVEERKIVSNPFDSLDIEVVTNKQDTGLASGNEAPSGDDKENHLVKKKTGKRLSKKKAKSRKTSKSETSLNSTKSDMELLDSLIQRKVDDTDYEDEDDLYFMIYCFFKDWNRLREYLQERWCDVQEGILGLSTVALITNTAIELLQRSEKELLSQLPRGESYESITNMLFYDVGLAHVDYNRVERDAQMGKVDMDEAISEEADWLCLPRYWHLVQWLNFAPPGKIPTNPEWIGVPIEFHTEGVQARAARDRRICDELLFECCLLKPLMKRSDFSIPGLDELTRDLRYILEEDAVKCHQELQHMGKRVTSILGNYREFTKDFAAPIGPVIKTTVKEVRCWIKDDFMEPQRTELHLRHGEDESDIEPYYYLRRHPILCGLMKFRFSLTLNELGLAESNKWGATIASAHLYNAIRHEDPSFPKWLDMEALIIIHSNRRIFWRDRLPSDPVQYSRSYERATGVSEAMEQRHLSSSGVMAPKKLHERGIGPVSVVSTQYHNRFCFAHDHRVETLPDVERILNESAEDEIEYSLSRLRLLEGPDAPGPSKAIISYEPAQQDSSRTLKAEGRVSVRG
ncbi:uncharacterized protein PAC_11980 [Phialocephala subalpina]|uniref:DUF6604 domain-containing protein n=1 Tax=Phialocephala subalpina TaxID=576137 RepID=A0A1L7XAM1_9HELO|nr:uncharacterized protein PAC_11980 [Phialocephala subalpina]